MFSLATLAFGNSYLLNRILNSGDAPVVIKQLLKMKTTTAEFMAILKEAKELCLATYYNNDELWLLQEEDYLELWITAHEKTVS